MLTIDLNSDLGESFGAYTIGADDMVIPLITSANVACGFHGGDPVVMRNTVRLCRENGISVGAHPGYPDLAGFGRRNMALSEDEIYTSLVYQIGALNAFCRTEGVRLRHVKPHGALYNTAVKSDAAARAICRAVADAGEGLVLLAPFGSRMLAYAAEMNVPYACEVFADRGYMPDGSLVPRGQPGAMITDAEEAAKRVIRMITEGRVTAADGTDIAVTADSVCVHGDNRAAQAFVETIRKALADADIALKPFDAR